MNRRFAAFAIAVLLAGCATRSPAPHASFSFAVVGDIGYSDREEPLFLETMRRIDAARPAFTVYAGDFKGAGACSDEFYARRHAQLDASAVPLVYTPGDNEWTDCRRRNMGSMDPIDRLKRLREVFFSEPWSLGRRRIATAAQDQCLATGPPDCGCAAHPENRRWSHGRVQFVTVNLPGSNNNVGFDPASDAEARCRNAANAEWLDAAARESERERVRALVVIVHGNPWDASAKHRDVYDGFLAAMAALPQRVRRPILFVHGDTHTYRVTPFNDARGDAVSGITRLETHGTPAVGWVMVRIDLGRQDPFSFEPHLVALSPPG